MPGLIVTSLRLNKTDRADGTVLRLPCVTHLIAILSRTQTPGYITNLD